MVVGRYESLVQDIRFARIP
jgi:hypothetical protein